MRQAREAFDDHSRRGSLCVLEMDLERNYAEDMVVLSERRLLKGCDAMRRSARQLELLPDPDSGYDLIRWLSIALGLVAALLAWPIDERAVPRLRLQT